MNILFVSQSSSLGMFDCLRNSLSEHMDVGEAGFVISDSSYYLKWLKNNSDFENQGHHLLKEWEVTSQRMNEPDYSMLAEYEKKIGAEPGLFGAIVADRRLIMGRNCTFTQDYHRRFSDDELLSILQAGIKEVEGLFNRLQPGLVISFICVTMLDYMVYLFAKSKGIKFLNIRTTRISDRIMLGSTLNDPTPEFIHAYENCLQNDSGYKDTAAEYIDRVREHHSRYEGVVEPSLKPAFKVNAARRNLVQTVLNVTSDYMNYRNSIASEDNHSPNPLKTIWYSAVANPLHARNISRKLSDFYANTEKMLSRRFAFFPLHTEPEVSLLVYGRPFLNQIEVIRTIALSLPADMILVIKEHPWMVGKRSFNSYRKLLDIPRVHLASPALEARELIKHSDLVTVLTSSIALEAVILQKPVITFGDCYYNALPNSMVSRCADLRNLPQLVKKILAEYEYDDNALHAYVSAVYETSESINLYSELLQRNEVYSERETNYDSEINKLSKYVVKCLIARGQSVINHKDKAVW